MIEDTRLNEWFVPKFGPLRFRVFIGLLFLPYTGMCISFAVIGSMLSYNIFWDRVIAIVIIYGLALGISAHAADSLGSKTKPWGYYLGKKQLWLLMVSSIVAAYSFGFYYILLYVPFLSIVAIAEGFFVFVYNFELFKGYFHNNFWFAISWGVLPVIAGFLIQSNSFGVVPFSISIITGLVSYLEIRISRSYKELKRRHSTPSKYCTKRLENQLKIISLTTIAFAAALVISRLIFV